MHLLGVDWQLTFPMVGDVADPLVEPEEQAESARAPVSANMPATMHLNSPLSTPNPSA
jgi:hypothetical protein